MKEGSLILACVALIAVGFAAAISSTNAVAPPRGAAFGSDASFGNITVRSITLTSGDGQHSILIRAEKNTVGIWVQNLKTKQHAILFSGHNAPPWLGLNDSKGNGCPIALALEDDTGLPFVQVTKGERVRHLTVDNLIRVADLDKGK